MLDFAKSSEFWEKVRTDVSYEVHRGCVFDAYESVKGDNLAHKFSHFVTFSIDGTRDKYEKNYFALRRKAEYLVILALMYPEKKEYISELEDALWNICDEFIWVLPAHADGATKVEQLESNIDLFSALTGTLLSIIIDLVGAKLHPMVVERVKREIDRRIVQTFEEGSFWWENVDNNWSAVCGGNTAITFMYNAPQKFCEQKPRFDRIMQNFLSGYGDDGVCKEGITYWNFGFGNFVMYAYFLFMFTDGKENLFDSAKVKSISKFCEKATLKNTTISFSDGYENGSYSVAVTNLLKSIYGDEITIPPKDRLDIYGTTRSLGFSLYSILLYNPDYISGEEKSNATLYMKDAGWFVKKTDSYAFAAKAGHNNEPHNHNDVGTFIIEKDGRQVICDLGAGFYTKEYFHGEHMYDVFCKSSRSHSVPIICGNYQGAGEEYSGTMSAENDKIKIEFENAYDVNGLSTLERYFEFSPKEILLRDRIRFEDEKRSVIERIISRDKPEISDGMVKLGGLKLISDVNAVCSTEEHKNHFAEIETIYCIDYEVLGEEFVLKILCD